MTDVETMQTALAVGGSTTIGAKTASFNTDLFINNYNEGGSFSVVVSAASGTTPTLSIKPQWSPDGGTTWVDLDATNGVTANLTAAGTASVHVGPSLVGVVNVCANRPLPRFLRVACTIGGTTPSFTITGIYFNGWGV